MKRAAARGNAKGAEPDGPNCNGCGSVFGMFNWKHHCRRCGKAFCDNCSKDRAVLSGPEFGKEPQRVCHPCKVAERRFRLEGQGKRGNRRESDDARSPPVVDLGLGADPLSGKELGQPITADDLQDPLMSAMLEDLGFGGAPQKAGSANKPVGKAGAPAVRGKGRAGITPPSTPGVASEAAVNDAVAAEKKRAVALRKAGKGDEALQVLRHAHELEAQAGADGSKTKGVKPKGGRGKSMFDISDADMVDPDLLAELQELGWSEEPAAKPKRKLAAASVTAGGGADVTAGGSTTLTAGGSTSVTPSKSPKITAGNSPDKHAAVAQGATAGGNAAVTPGNSPDKRAALEAEVTARKRAALQLRKSGQLEKWHAEMAALRELQAQLDQQGEAPLAAGPQVPASNTGAGAGSVAGMREGAKNEAPSSASKQDLKPEASLGSHAEQRTDRTGGTADGPASKEALETAILSRKRAALACKKAGDLEGAKAAMKEARQLENQLASASHVADVNPPAVGAPLRDGVRAGASKPLVHEPDHHDPEVTSDDEADPEIAAALREMGWQDGTDSRTEPASLRRQLSDRKAGEGLDALVGAVEGVATQKAAMASEALAHKRAALAKKRAGDVEGAKEDLRQAKMIEARLEEAEAAEAAGLEPLDGLLRAGGRGASPAARGAAAAAPLATIVADAMRPDVGEVAAPDVDSDDETDPEILAALREMGWQDEKPGRAAAVPERGAVRQQTGGGQIRRTGGAAAQLVDVGEDDVAVTSDDEQDPAILAALQEMGWQDERPALSPASALSAPSRPAARPRSREELLAQASALKRQALGLRKQGKMDEWRATLMEAQELEREAEQVGTARPAAAAPAAAPSRPAVTAGGDDGADAHVEVTEDDETDPAMQAALRALGWQEDDPPPRSVPVGPPRGAPIGRSSMRQKSDPVRNTESHGLTPVESTGGYRVNSGDSNVGRQSFPVDSTGAYSDKSGNSYAGQPINPVDSTGGDRVTPVSAGPLPLDLFSTAVEPVTPTAIVTNAWSNGQPWTRVNGPAGHGVDSAGDRVSGGYPVAGETGLRVQEAQPVSRVSGNGALPSTQGVPGSTSPVDSTDRPGRRASQESGERPLRALEDRRRSQSSGQSEASGTGSGPPLYWPESSPETDREHVSTPSRRYSPTSAGALGTGFVSGGKSSPGEAPGRRESSSTAGTSSVPPPLKPETSPGDEWRRVSTSGRQDGALPAAAPVGASAADLEERVRTGKQTAVRLKREGRLQEARAALMQAREWERQLAAQQAPPVPSDGPSSAPAETDGDDVTVEDALDPAMVAALKGLGWTDEQIRGGMGGGGGKKPAARPVVGAAAGNGDRTALEDRIRSEKLRALGLKRAGMQQEALTVLRSVKQLEKQLG